MRLGLVYLPDPESMARCVALSESLARGQKARVVLGDGRVPHVTLLHVETNGAGAAEALWREAVASLPKAMLMSFRALAFLRYDRPYNAPDNAPDGAPPATMAYLIVPCTKALREAEERALSLPFVRGVTVTTGNGERFMPHVTLAIWEGLRGPETLTLPQDTVERDGVVGALALGVIGPNGVYERTLFGGDRTGDRDASRPGL
ncbi:MAG: hypothetical protein V9F06_03230 [Thermomicrobiales bacterium]